VDQRLADAGKEGISEEVLDAAFDLTTAVMAGLMKNEAVDIKPDFQ
jgi:hypothetical protein